MHKLVCPDDGIHRADFTAIGTANTQCLVDERERVRLLRASGKRDRIACQQICQSPNRLVATGRTQVDCCIVFDNRKRLRSATRVAALRTLCLRQQLVDFFDQ